MDKSCCDDVQMTLLHSLKVLKCSLNLKLIITYIRHYISINCDFQNYR